MNQLFSVVALSSAMIPGAPAVAAEPAIIILDGSGSMWGQIAGRPKHEIARRVAVR